jgi:secreted trypsin-like serine protease
MRRTPTVLITSFVAFFSTASVNYAFAQPSPDASGGGPQVIGGTLEPDYRYPWVVRAPNCGGVLIHPRWVLTAAHCVTGGFNADMHWEYERTDLYDGSLHKVERYGACVTPCPNHGAYVHPMWDPSSSSIAHDIALIRVNPPFPIDRYFQTVALPTIPRQADVVGTVASIDQTRVLPAGQIATFRAPIPWDVPPFDPLTFTIHTSSPSGSVCHGDSGSGFVTHENGRATVRGILSFAWVHTDVCSTTNPAESQGFTDVFAYRDWILETMQMADFYLAGTNRLRWEPAKGTGGARGFIQIQCDNLFGMMKGPTDVFGVELGANCEPGQWQSVICAVEIEDPSDIQHAIAGFTMKTRCPAHTREQSLPFSYDWAGYTDLTPAPNSPDGGVCIREFSCGIGRERGRPIEPIR